MTGSCSELQVILQFTPRFNYVATTNCFIPLILPHLLLRFFKYTFTINIQFIYTPFLSLEASSFAYRWFIGIFYLLPYWLISFTPVTTLNNFSSIFFLLFRFQKRISKAPVKKFNSLVLISVYSFFFLYGSLFSVLWISGSFPFISYSELSVTWNRVRSQINRLTYLPQARKNRRLQKLKRININTCATCVRPSVVTKGLTDEVSLTLCPYSHGEM